MELYSHRIESYKQQGKSATYKDVKLLIFHFVKTNMFPTFALEFVFVYDISLWQDDARKEKISNGWVG